MARGIVSALDETSVTLAMMDDIAGALAVLHHTDARPARVTEVSVLIAANLLATIVRFGLYRSWVFRGGPHHLNRNSL